MLVPNMNLCMVKTSAVSPQLDVLAGASVLTSLPETSECIKQHGRHITEATATFGTAKENSMLAPSRLVPTMSLLSG